MPVDTSYLRDILSLFRIQEVRTIVDEKGYTFKSNKKDELIEELIEKHDWTEDEVDEIVDRYRRIAEGKRPLGYYLLDIDESQNLETVSSELLDQEEAEFDSDGDLISGGFQLGEVSENRLEATLWDLKKEKQFDGLTGEVQESTRKDSVGVIVDASSDYIRIETTNYQKAKGVRSTFQELGFELGPIGHKDMLSEDANDLVDEFVGQLENRLENERGEADNVS